MKILFRNSGSKWKMAKTIKPGNESELQKLFAKSPSLIPINEIREGASPLIFAVREYGIPGVGNIDILAFSPEGDIAIVECKLATNAEIKRKVIGQIMEYASHLWQMSYEDLNSRIKAMEERSLSELMEEKVSEEYTPEDFDEEYFRTNVHQNLKEGNFVLVITVDEINDELKRIIQYLNDCSESAFTIHALEIYRFQAEETEVLVPNLYGESTKPKPKDGDTKQKRMGSIEEFLNTCDEKGQPFFEELLRGSISKGLTVHWGTVGFALGVDKDGTFVPICWGFSPNSKMYGQSIVTKFKDIKKKVKGADEIVEEFQGKFSDLGFIQKTEMQFTIKQKLSQEKSNEIIETLFDLAEKIKERELVE